VDDDRAIREFCKVILEPMEVEMLDCTSAEEAKEALHAGSFDIILADFQLPGEDGIKLLRFCRENDPSQVVIIITGHGSVDSAVEAMKEGAFDYIQKPVAPDVLRATVRKAASQRELARENIRLRRLLREKYSFSRIIGKSREMEQVFRTIQRVAPSDSTVLLIGEGGTGKELIARAIHVSSKRESRPFQGINLSALPETTIESELFGHVRGAFPGAVSAKDGLLRECHRGTIFLNDVGSAGPSLQAKLLRFLQTGEFRPVGAEKDVKVDTRIIAATRRDLRIDVDNGRFREDLFYCLNVITIPIPPLRNRKDDIPLLAHHFIRKFSSPEKEPLDLSAGAKQALMAYNWPGNVQELRNTIERACLLAAGPEILADDLGEEVRKGNGGADERHPTAGRAEVMSLEEGEKIQIEHVFRAMKGHRGKTAKALQISRRSLYDKLKRYGITL
jgi:DNA-binding NtrC family response regulator